MQDFSLIAYLKLWEGEWALLAYGFPTLGDQGTGRSITTPIAILNFSPAASGPGLENALGIHLLVTALFRRASSMERQAERAFPI